jgi:plastocyanin
MVRGLFVALALVLGTGSLSAADFTVEVGPGMTFTPNTVTIQQGDTVIWHFLEGNHSTTSNATTGLDAWDSGIVAEEGGDFQRIFFTAGNHPYYCKVHSSAGGFAMNGTVIVDADLTPFIAGFDPTTGPTTGGTTVTITGSNFAFDCQVDFGGFAAATTFVNENTLEAVTPAVPEEGGFDVNVACATGTDSGAEFGPFEFFAPAVAGPAVPTASDAMLLVLAAALAAISLVAVRKMS